MAVQIQLRRGTASAWTTANPTLAVGEFAIETDTDLYKIGDGSTAWTSLGYSSLPSTAIASGGGTFTGTLNFGVDGTGQDVNFFSATVGDHMKWDASEEQLVITGTSGATALNVADGNVVIAGDLTVNGTSVNLSTTNTVIEDVLIELNNGASSNANDLGIVMERGSTGDNAIIAWDESADKFTMGTTTATGASTGNLSITAGTLVADLEGDVTGDVTGNADTATEATNVTAVANNSTDETVYPTFVDGATGTQGLETDTDLMYNPSTGVLTSTGFTGAVIGNVTGNASGTAATVTGAAQTAITSVGTLTSLAVSGGLVAPLQINAQTGTSYTFVLADAGKLVTSSNGSAQTFTVPPNSSVAYDIGTQIMVQNIGSANCTLAQGSGVTLRSKDSAKAIDGQYSAATLIKTATDVWSLIGSLA